MELQTKSWRFGVDGCKAGWFFVGHMEGHFEIGTVSSVAELIDKFPNVQEIVIDVPIGLWDKGDATRDCDIEARRLLKPRGSTVFPAPLRPCLLSASYKDACSLSERLSGKKLSQQAFNIFGKIKEVDQLLRQTPRLRSIVREAHPELGFCMLNGGTPIMSKKKRTAGIEERLALLNKTLSNSCDLYNQAMKEFLRKEVARDDIVDAIMCMVIALGDPSRRGAIPQKRKEDNCGLEMAMHFVAQHHLNGG